MPQSALCEKVGSGCPFRWHSAHTSPRACRPQEHFACRKSLRKDVTVGVLAGVTFECVCRRAFMSYASASTRYPTWNGSVCRFLLNRMPEGECLETLAEPLPDKRTSVFGDELRSVAFREFFSRFCLRFVRGDRCYLLGRACGRRFGWLRGRRLCRYRWCRPLCSGSTRDFHKCHL